MNKIDVLFFGQRDDAFDVQISGDRSFSLTNQVSLVGLEPMHGQPVFLRINRNRPQTKLGRGTKQANGYLAPVCHQQPFELVARRNSIAFGTTLRHRHISPRVYKETRVD